MAAFACAVALHVAVAAGLMGMAGTAPEPRSGPEGFRMVSLAGGGGTAAPTEPAPQPEPAPAAPAPRAQAPEDDGLRPVPEEPEPEADPGPPPTKTHAAPLKKAAPAPERATPTERPREEDTASPKSSARRTARATEPAAEEASPSEAPRKEQTPAETPHPNPDPGPKEDAGGGEYQPPSARAGGLDNAPPNYPYLARRKGLEGKVLLKVAVGPDGRAREVTVAQSSGHEVLDRTARKAVGDWRFRPASRGGRPVAGTVKVPIRFNLSRGR